MIVSLPSRSDGIRRIDLRLLLFIAIICAALAEAVWLKGRMSTLGDFGWDEAAHALWGMHIYQDVIHSNWLSWAFDTYRQVYWPFLHSWAIAASMLVLGVSPESARAVSLVSFLGTGVVLAYLVRRMSSSRDWVAPVVVAGLWLTAGHVIDTVGIRALTDGPAVLVTSLALVALDRATEKPTLARSALAGALVMVTYLTKTGFGVVLLLAVVAAAILWSRRVPSRRPGPSQIAVFLAVIVGIGLVWFAYPPKIAATVSALLNRSQGPPPFSWAGLTYHPRRLAVLVGGGWTLLVLLTALVLAIARGRSPILLTAAACVLVALVLHTLSHTKDPKHMVKAVPNLFLVGGWAVSQAWTWCRSHGRRSILALAGLLLVLAGVRIRGLLSSDHAIPDTFPAVRSALVQHILPDEHNLVLGEFGGLSKPLVDWSLLSQHPEAVVLPDEHLEQFENLMARWLPRHPWIRYLEHERPAQILWVDHAPGRDGTDIQDPHTLLARLVREDNPRRIIDVGVSPTSRWYGDRHFVFEGERFLPSLRANPCFRRAGSVGPDRGVEFSVWDAVPGCSVPSGPSADAERGREPPRPETGE